MPAAKKSSSTKETRCWPGYEPVPGKAQHSQGSCRPKAKKTLKPAQKKFRSARERQLARWEKAHPGSPRKAAQHLHAPESSAKRKSKPAHTKSHTGKRKSGAARSPEKKLARHED